MRLYDCCLETDGACAVIVTSTERARDLAKPPVAVLGAAEGHPYPADDLPARTDMLKIELHGEMPINVNGGLLSEAHVWGLNNVVEVVLQLRHDVGDRQVADAELAI